MAIGNCLIYIIKIFKKKIVVCLVIGVSLCVHSIVQSFREAREGGRQILAYDWKGGFGGHAHRKEFFENHPPFPPPSLDWAPP